jgi:DGQHR domain-containing protein
MVARKLELGGALEPLLEEDALRQAFRRRRDGFDYVKVPTKDEAASVETGWSMHKRTQSHVWMKKPKAPDVLLEDRIWCLFFRLGYPHLNAPKFRVDIKSSDGGTESRRINVLALDDETAIVVECRARQNRGRRSLQKDIEEFEAAQKKIGSIVRGSLPKGRNPKIVWIFATTNIIWAEKDLERADAANIRVVSENELQYFEAFVSHIGTAGRYQFLAEFLEGQEIPNLQNVRVPAVKGRFGAHTYYNFVVSARHLLKIAFVNHHALNHPDGRPAYQRMINKKRIADIGQFIQRGGYFPTNILINFTDACRFDLLSNKDNADQNIKFGWLYLPSRYKSAWIIDGQHRLYGFSNIPDHLLDTNLFVLAFEKMDTKTEADLFITINHEQKSVSKSLLVTLQADLKLGSGDPKEAILALSSALIKAVNNDNSSPFFRRFEVPGVTAAPSQNLTIAEAVKGLVRSNLFGKVLSKRSRVPGYFSAQTDDETLTRARKIVNDYFRAIMDANPERWERGRAGYICVNPGVRAHFQLVQEVLQYLAQQGHLDPMTDTPDKVVTQLVSFVEPVRAFITGATDKQVEPKFARKFGDGGVAEYYFNLCELIQRKHKEFGSPEFKRYKEREADARVQQTDRDVNDLQHWISHVVIETLKKLHGMQELSSGEKAYWELGIENSEIKQSAYKKQQMTPVAKRSPKEAYIDLIDFDKIIRQQNNWSTFEPIFSIPLPDEKGKKYYLAWLERLNEVRRLAAHKSPYRQYTDEDLEFVGWIKNQLFDRFTKAGFDVT